MIGIVDDCTSLMWGNMLKRKKDQVPTMMNFLRRMKARGTPIKYIRCDNAGENKELQKKCLQTQDLCGIQFEFTSRDSPQFNGKIERKFAVIFSRMRANFEAANIDMKLRRKLWGEACMTAIDIENLLVSSGHDEPSYREFYKKDLPKAEEMRQFGEMAVIKVSKQIKGKLQNRGIPGVYLGRARDHAGDTHRFLNLQTELVLTTRDIIWLNKVYGDYKGSKMEVNWDTVGIVPKLSKRDPQPQQEPNRIAQQEESLQEQNVRPNRNQEQEIMPVTHIDS